MLKNEYAIIFIQNSEGDFFVHQRLSTKKTFPNRYGIGAGGHVEVNEEIHEAAKRELEEETKLKTPVEYLYSQEFFTPQTNCISHCFLTKTDDHIDVDESEWQWAGWLSKREVDELDQQGKLCDDTSALYRRFIDTIDV